MSPEGQAVLAGLRVLVAEDEPMVALELEATLRGAGCAVLGPVAEVREGLALLATLGAPDAALVNARLRDGLATPLVKALRAEGVRIGLATGYALGELEPELRDVPMLRKPHRPSDVTGFVLRLVGEQA